LIFINAIGSLESSGKIFMFADDAVLINVHDSKNVQSIENTMLTSFLPILEFFKHRKLSLNASKTNFILFQSKSGKIKMNRSIKVDDHTEISQETSTKYLGLIINDTLDWSEHINSIRSKVGSAAGILWKLRDVLPTHARKMIFNALVLSHIRYMIFIWGFSPWSKLKDLQVIHNRCLRSVFNIPNRSNRCEMFLKQVDQNLPIRGMCVVNTAIMMYKALSGRVHTNMKFELAGAESERRLRNHSELRPRSSKSKKGDQSFENMGPRIFNKTPETVKQSKTVNNFRWLLQKHLKTEEFIESCFKKKFYDLKF
jgi:hypothetical protein